MAAPSGGHVSATPTPPSSAAPPRPRAPRPPVRAPRRAPHRRPAPLCVRARPPVPRGTPEAGPAEEPKGSVSTRLGPPAPPSTPSSSRTMALHTGCPAAAATAAASAAGPEPRGHPVPASPGQRELAKAADFLHQLRPRRSPGKSPPPALTECAPGQLKRACGGGVLTDFWRPIETRTRRRGGYR